MFSVSVTRWWCWTTVNTLIDETAALVDILLGHCPRLHVLATSRQVLDIGGETVLPLAPLDCPERDNPPSLEGLVGYDAVALFLARARAAAPGFGLTEHNAADVADICARLDGLPLGIELAAARLKVMAVEHIAEGLSEHYNLLSRGRRGLSQRQQSLQHCIEWSYALCSTAEQHLWAQLSVFAGSFDLDAAHHVCGQEYSREEFLDLLHGLVDKSILTRTDHHGAVRFRLLETLREYGHTHLSDSADTLRRRHAHWYQQFLSQVRAHWFGPHQIESTQRVMAEMPNIREALEYSLATSPTSALQMSSDLRPIWLTAGMLSEGRRWLDLALAAASPQPSVLRIRALADAALLIGYQGDLAAGQLRIAEARNLLTLVDHPETRAMVDCFDGHYALLLGDLQRARTYSEEALAATNDPEIQLLSRRVIGWVFDYSGDVDHASHWFEATLAVAESHGESVWRSNALWIVGTSRWRQGQKEVATQLLHHSLQLAHVINDPINGAQCLEGLAWIAGAEHKPRRAALLMAAADSLGRSGGTVLFIALHMKGFHEQCAERARTELGEQQFQAAWNQGTALTFDEAVAIALQTDD